MSFAATVVRWYHQSGRKDLPWQQNPTPYRVWVSEIMLQQTQVSTVIDYYQRFMQRFPDVSTLAISSLDDVLNLWSGLGYYARARNLHQSACEIVQRYNGQFPDTVDELETLPGIGRSTAGAIVSLAFQKPAVILDGNVKRVLARVFAIKTWTGETNTLKQLWDLATQHTPTKEVAAYNQAMMDLGATVCTRSLPQCDRCPLTSCCEAYAQQLQHVLPVTKPKKTLPERNGRMMIIIREPRTLESGVIEASLILLQKRPSPGIWGGLWCFPEYDETLLQQFTSVYQQAGEVSSHTFSHYRWHVQTDYISVNGALPDLSSDFLWYNPQEDHHLGLAAVVKRLLPALMEFA